MNTSNTAFLRRAKSLHSQEQVIGQQRILVVESDGMTRLMSLLFLRRLGFVVDWAVNPSMALHKLRAGCLDVLLLGLPLRGGAVTAILNAIPNESKDDGQHRPVRVYVYALTHQMDRATCKAVAARADQVIDKATTPPDALILGIAADILQAPVHPDLLQTSRDGHSEIAASSDSHGQLAEAVAQLREDSEHLLLNRHAGTFPAECRELKNRLQCLGSLAVQMKLDALGREAIALAERLQIHGNDLGPENEVNLQQYASGLQQLMKLAGDAQLVSPGAHQMRAFGVQPQDKTMASEPPGAAAGACSAKAKAQAFDPLARVKAAAASAHSVPSMSVKAVQIRPQPADIASVQRATNAVLAADAAGGSRAASQNAVKLEEPGLGTTKELLAEPDVLNPAVVQPAVAMQPDQVRSEALRRDWVMPEAAGTEPVARMGTAASESPMELEPPGLQSASASQTVQDAGSGPQAWQTPQSQLESTLAASPQLHAELEAKYAEARTLAGQRIEALERELKNGAEAFHKQSEALQRHQAAAEAAQEGFARDRQEWQTRRCQLESDLTALRQSHDELMARHEASLADSAKQQEALKQQMQEAVTRCQQRVGDLETQLASAIGAIREAQARHAEAQRRCEQLAGELTALRQSYQALHHRHEASVVGSVQRLEALKHQMQEAAAELQKRQDELQVQLGDVKTPASPAAPPPISSGESAGLGAAMSAAGCPH